VTGGGGLIWQNTLTDNLRKLCQDLAKKNVPTIHVTYYDEKFFPKMKSTLETFETTSRTWWDDHHLRLDKEFISPVEPSGLVAVKRASSVLDCLPLLQHLRDNKIEKVILSGLFEARRKPVERACVSISARDLVTIGYDVVIAAETTNAFSVDLKERQQLHRHLGVHVRATKDIVRSLDKTDDGPVRNLAYPIVGHQKAKI